MIFPTNLKPPLQIEFVGDLTEYHAKLRTEIMAYFKPRKNNNGDEYYEKLALSNSFLNHVLKCVAGTKEWGTPSNAFEIGKAFEDVLMQKFDRQRYAKTISQNELENILLMAEKFNLSFGNELKIRINEDHPKDFPYLGLKFKAKTDFETSDTTFDIKTTSKVDMKGCQASIYAYNYHTQGLLYEIATGKPFVLLFQSKSYPFDNFKIELSQKMREKAKLKIDKAIHELERLELLTKFEI